MTQLQTIPVLFNQEQHTYTDKRNGNALKGITSTLIHRLFPDKYANIPQAILAKAAQRGSVVHEEIELIETIGVTPSTEEGKNYMRLKEKYGLTFLESEYMVSDLEHYASQIDLVFEAEDGVVDIVDIKTTSKFDRDSVSWQLSIYAYFLTLNNPSVKVRNLYGIWLRGDIAELIKVDLHGAEEVKALIKADQEDKPFEWSPEFPSYITENEASLYAIGRRIKELTEEYDSIKAEVLAKMIENKDKSFDTGNVLITLMAASERTTFDSKAFQKEHEDLYGQFLKKTKTKESLKLTLR